VQLTANYLSFAWQELTDVDILHESEEGADGLIDALLGQQICALLVQNLERLDETVKEEGEGVHNTLGKCNSLPHVTQNFVLKHVCFYPTFQKWIGGL
jgi:beta-catenin-like protein 1